MTKHVLNVINQSMTALGIEYAFAVYEKQEIVYPYFVGEYQETEPLTEDGLQECTFILTGFTRGKWIDLETIKEKIADYFTYEGKSFVSSESAVVVSYGNGMIVPTGDPELKRIQINLTIKEWKV